jgi:3-oxoacyl-[acyl-carrier protein] reductase
MVAVAVVTGASRDPGRQLARDLARRRLAVVVVYLLSQRDADAVVDEILLSRGTAVAVRADLTDELDVERVFVEAALLFGGVDVVVHAAGRGAGVVFAEAARRLRPGGAIFTLPGAEIIAPALVRDLGARGVSVTGLDSGDAPPSADHGVEAVLALVDRWRRA